SPARRPRAGHVGRQRPDGARRSLLQALERACGRGPPHARPGDPHARQAAARAARCAARRPRPPARRTPRPAAQGALPPAPGDPYTVAEHVHLPSTADDRPREAPPLVAPVATRVTSLRGGDEEEGSPCRRRPTPQSSRRSATPRPTEPGRSRATRT